MPKYALLIDYTYCTGCHTCEVVCKEEHDLGVGKWGIRLYQDGPWKKSDEGDQGRDFNFNYVPVPTDLCDLCVSRLERHREPACVHNCLGDCMRFGTVEEMAQVFAQNPKQVMWAPCDVDVEL